MLPEFAAFIATHWLQIAAIGAFGAVVGLWGVFGPQLLANRSVGEAQPDLADCDCEDCWWESVPRETLGHFERLATDIDFALWEDQLRWRETEEST